MLTLLIASATWTGAKADDFLDSKDTWASEIDGIFYYLTIETEKGKVIRRDAIVTNSQMKPTGSTLGANSYKGAIIIPETIEFNLQEFKVVAIQDYAFYGSEDLTTVSIPKTVTSIGYMAFYNCQKLSSINVAYDNQNYFTSNGALLDKDKTQLYCCPAGKEGSYNVPSTVTAIADDAFAYCGKITNVNLPEGLLSIGNSAFYRCTSLASINLPSTLNTIGENAFFKNESLSSSITIPSGVMTINNYTFKDCNKLSNVVLSEGLININTSAFQNCTSLKSISLPNSLAVIGTFAFSNSGLTSIAIPDNVTEIAAASFAECKLTSITLPSELTKINNRAFADNGTTINTLNIPATVSTIGNEAFNGTNIKNIYINNIPRNIQIGATSTFKKVSGMQIHVFTLLDNDFKNATNWSAYKDYFVADIAIRHIAGISLNKTKLTMSINKTSSLIATILPENADVKDVVFTSSDSKIVTITNAATGEFASNAIDGEVTITCTAADGSAKYATCKVTVRNQFVPAETVTINKTTAKITIGKTLKLKAQVFPSEATYPTVTWKSSDENVATVYINGVVTAVAPGNVTITARSTDGYVSAICDVFVNLAVYNLKDGEKYSETKLASTDELNYTRNFKNTSWQPLYIPFRMSYEDWSDNFEVAKLTNIHSYDTDGDGQIDDQKMEWLKVKSGTLKENHPYLIRAKQTGEQTITVKDATIYPAENNSIQCSSTEYTYDFKGVYETTTGLRSIGGYIMSGGVFGIAASDDSKVNSFRFYLQITAKDGQVITTANEAKIIVLDEFGNEETTAINEIDSNQSNVTAVYNVNGIKQSSTKQGLNIIKMANGTTKKIFIK